MSILTAQPSGDELLEAVADLDTQALANFVDQVLALQAQRRGRILPDQEATLLQQVNLGIAPDIWQQYNMLKTKRRSATLTTAEHAALLDIGDQIERANARRISALIQLADLRHTSLEALMDQLGILPLTVE